MTTKICGTAVANNAFYSSPAPHAKASPRCLRRQDAGPGDDMVATRLDEDQ